MLDVYGGACEVVVDYTETSITDAISNGGSALTAAAVDIPLADASSFPDSGIIRIGTEDIEYSGKSTNTLTGCTRGYAFTVAAEHVDTSAVTLLEKDVWDTKGNISIDNSALNVVNKLGTDQKGVTKIVAGKITETIKVKVEVAEIDSSRLEKFFGDSAEKIVDGDKVCYKIKARKGSLTKNTLRLFLRYEEERDNDTYNLMFSFPKVAIIEVTNFDMGNEQDVFSITCDAV